MSVNRILVNIVSDEPERTAIFYETLLDFDRAFDSDWFVNLKHESSAVEIGVIKHGHEVVPEGVSDTPGGGYLTFVVDDVGRVAALARSSGAPILQEPMDTSYGQRRMLVRDPQGNIVDISAPQANAPA